MRKTILFWCLFISLVGYSQGPAGIQSGLKMWLRADAEATLAHNDGLLNSWVYANDVSKSFQSASTRRPQVRQNQFNFRPAITFSGAQEMIGPINQLAPLEAHDDDYSLFVVWKGASSSGYRIWTQWGCTSVSGEGFAFQTGSNGNKYGAQFETIAPGGPTPAAGIVQTYAPGDLLISQLNVLNQASNDLEIIDSRNFDNPKVATVGNGVRDLSTKGNILGRRCSISGEPFSGDLAELIVFDRPISGVEREKIFSYLSIKYGINLQSRGVRTSLYASDWNGVTGTTFWSGMLNANYAHDLFGIGRDDAAGFVQAISNSMNTGTGDGRGQAGKGNIILSKPAHLDNLDYLMVGHNGDALAEQATDMPIFMTTDARRLSREWKIQRTGDPGPVQLSFDLTGIATSGNSQTVMIVDEDGDGNFTTGRINLFMPSSRDGNHVIFENVTLGNNQIFTFVTNADFLLLPLQWLEIKALYQLQAVSLEWTIVQTDIPIRYEVERSIDGRHFTTLAHVDAQPLAGTAHYSFKDQSHPVGHFFYRVKAVMPQHSSRYSPIAESTIPTSARLPVLIYPNPFKDHLFLEINERKAGIIHISVKDASGATVRSIKRTYSSGKSRFSLAAYLPSKPGLWFILTEADSRTTLHKVIRQ
ncbi:MAG TPA: T9SS type A sorting domain-containing protein [Flavisolibacter sp.]|nr:T9SS type A sorting domain-containing protein [Flavisolibacter sp.]